MAKESMKAREVKRQKLVAKYAAKRKALKEALDIDIDVSTLSGQVGAVCSNDDPVAGLGKVNNLVKQTK